MPNIEENKQAFIDICHQFIARDGVDDLLEWLSSTDFFSAPASSRFHGCEEGGLVSHSLHVYEQLSDMLYAYDMDDKIPFESAVICSLFHDICKANYYQKSTRNVKNPDTGRWETKDTYIVNDQLPLGHGEKSCILLQQFIKLTPQEMMAIRHHMGGFDSAVKGGDYSLSKAYDQCPLAVLLHLADMAATYLIENRK